MSGQTTKVFGDVQEGELMGDCQTCAICQEDFEEDSHLTIIDPCKHGFHQGCLDRWLRRKQQCPVCKLWLVDNVDGTNSDSFNSSFSSSSDSFISTTDSSSGSDNSLAGLSEEEWITWYQYQISHSEGRNNK